MATDNRVTPLMRENDFNTFLTVFDTSSSKRKKDTLYEDWIETIRRCLGNCIFRTSFGILYLYTTSKIYGPCGVTSTQDVLEFITHCFETPETFRIEIMTQTDTATSWLIVLSEDLK